MGLFSKKANTTSTDNKKAQAGQTAVRTATGVISTDSARIAANDIAKSAKFQKPKQFDRTLLDSTAAKNRAKANAFGNRKTIKDPYTGKRLYRTQAEAKARYGENWAAHAAETDHNVSLKKIHTQTRNKPWVTNKDVRNAANSPDNLTVTSRKYNNAKRDRSNKNFVNNKEHSEGVGITEEGRNAAIRKEKRAQKSLNRQFRRSGMRNAAKAGHEAGLTTAKDAGQTALAMSGILNITAVIKGEKDVKTALLDTAKDGVKAAATGYVMGGGLTVVSHTLSESSSPFLKALGESNVPGYVITAVIVTGDTLKRYSNGEITTEECITELGNKGVTMVGAKCGMSIGEVLIPIPVIGGVIGSLVGATLADKLYNELMYELKYRQLEHEERLRIMKECDEAKKAYQDFRKELEDYLKIYFKEFQDCFDEALNNMKTAFQSGDADGVIGGANQITGALGGTIHYRNVEEGKKFLFNGTTDVL